MRFDNFKGRCFNVQVVYPNIMVITNTGPFNTKVICNSEPLFEKTLRQVIDPFGLNKEDVFRWALNNNKNSIFSGLILYFLELGLFDPDKQAGFFALARHDDDRELLKLFLKHMKPSINSVSYHLKNEFKNARGNKNLENFIQGLLKNEGK